MTKTRLTVEALAAGALLRPAGDPALLLRAAGQGQGEGPELRETEKVGFQVAGTLVAWTADDPAVEGTRRQ